MKDVSVVIDPTAKPTRLFQDGVKIKGKEDRTPTLILNNQNTYKYVPKYLADQMVKEHKAFILTPSDSDYLKGTKLALGKWEGFKDGEIVQFKGEAHRIEEILAFDTAELIRRAEEEVKAHKGDKKVEVATELPSNASAFEEKAKERRFGQ